MGEKKVELEIEKLEERIAPDPTPCFGGSPFFCEEIVGANFANGNGTVYEVTDGDGNLVGGRLITPGGQGVFVPLRAIGRFG